MAGCFDCGSASNGRRMYCSACRARYTGHGPRTEEKQRDDHGTVSRLKEEIKKLRTAQSRLLKELEFVVNDPASTDAVRVRLIKATLAGFRGSGIADDEL